MSSFSTVVVSVLSILVLCLCHEGEANDSCLASFECGKLGRLWWPFVNTTNRECGSFVVDGCHHQSQQTVQFEKSGKRYEVLSIFQSNAVHIRDRELRGHLKNQNCKAFSNLSLPTSPLFYLKIDPNITLFKCNDSLSSASPQTDHNYTGCDDGYTIYYNDPHKPIPPVPPHCSMIQLPAAQRVNSMHDPFALITTEFDLAVQLSGECEACIKSGRFCEDKKGKAVCPRKGNGSRDLKMWTGVGCSAITVLVICSILFAIKNHCRKKHASSSYFSAKPPFDPSSNLSFEKDTAYFGIPVFTYSELEEATNYFDSGKELGEGGFGTVYYGQLRDGREVAVKRLYEKNCKHVQQFTNEIKILTCLRHQNLVTLYGCTSRQSRELLLVYEFIPNGTVADHLHGERAVLGLLTWPIRLRIAVETASALSYLHASDIIHRDVKTSNILLDKNFHVKVADFGLSRLFPNDISHISTAPQGTPGYVDPEYHQCYQLTDKSDVYSFGVVLTELISSLPAVDMCRAREDINLANLAMNRILKGAFHHLVDPALGFESNSEIRRITTLVAELAFQCLQIDKGNRPCIEEVLGVLKSIQGGVVEENTWADNKVKALGSRDMFLNRFHLQTSPNSVTDKWISRSATPNISV